MAVQGSMECLPLDIIQDIVSRVPAESVLGCKLVCKNWGTLICRSSFPDMHLKRQLKQHYDGDEDNDNLAAKVESCLFIACRIDGPGVFKTLLFHGGQVSDRICNDRKYIYKQNLKRIYHPPMHKKSLCSHLVSSCNGLVCAFQRHNTIQDPIYICNPLTREYVYLPQLVVKKKDVHPGFLRMERGDVNMHSCMACGFGYARSTNEYKVVRIHYLTYTEGNVEVYTLGSGCGWRAIGTVSYRLCTPCGGRGTYANDAIYWISHDQVVAFDLADEEFRLISSPPCLQNCDSMDICGLAVLGGHLCVYMIKLRVEIWSLTTKSSDSKETWRMQFDIDYKAVVSFRPFETIFQPILLTKKGEIIFLYPAEPALYCYDTKTAILKIISSEASADYLKDIEAIAHMDTLASLEAIGESSKRYTVRTSWDDVRDGLDQLGLGEGIDTTRFRFGRSTS